MPRDGSGNYTLPAGNPVVDGTIIDVAWANPTMSDVATQLNNLVTRDGLLFPTAPLKFQLGTAALPGITFSGDTDTGIYSPGANQLSITTAGVQRLAVGATGNSTLTATAGVALAVTGVDGVVESLTAPTDTRLSLVVGATQYGIIQSTANLLNLAGIGAATVINLSTNGATRQIISAAGNVTINAPASGNTVAASLVSGGIGFKATGPAATTTVGFALLQTGQQEWQIYSPASSNDLRFFGGRDTLSITNAGNVTIPAPSSGVGLTQTGFAGSDTALFNGGTSGSFRVTDRGLPYGTSIHNNAGTVTGTTNQYIASGTYTPTLVNVANLASSNTVTGTWMRVGNVVTVSLGANLVPTAASTLTRVGIPLPIATTFTTIFQCTGAAGAGVTGLQSGFVQADTTNARALLEFTSNSTGSSGWSTTFTYEVR